jgi:hypothetical protein
MVRFEEIQAALNAPGVVTSTPLSFNQLKIEIAKRLHIEADDAVFTESKQALKDAYVAVYTKVCNSTKKSEPAAIAKKPAASASKPPASKPPASKPPASKPPSRSAPVKKTGKKRQDSESEEEESDASESGSESSESERGGRPASAFASDPEARRLTALAK